MRPISFLRTLTFRVVLLQALLVAFVVAALFGLVWRELHAYVEDQLRNAVEVETASLLAAARDGTVAEQIQQHLVVRPDGPDYYLLTDGTGTRIVGNLVYGPSAAGWQTATLTGAAGRHKTHASAVALLASPISDGRWLVVGRDNRDLGELDENLSRYFCFSVGVIVVLALLSGGAAGHFFVRGIDQLGSDAERVIAGEIAGPVAHARHGAEFERLAGRLNRMLERIAVLMDNMRQVSNDVAHDLRTPLTRLRHGLESAQLACGDSRIQDEAIERAIAEVDEILGTFSAILRISRIETRERQAGFSQIDLSRLFSEMAENYVPVAEDQGKAIRSDISPGIQARGDSMLLTQMLANLVENAIHHTPRGTRIAVRLRNEAGRCVGCVEDDGPGIPAEHHGRVFRRFFRLDSARSSGGCGLGLALVAAVADLHRIAIELQDRRPGVAVVMRFSG